MAYSDSLGDVSSHKPHCYKWMFFPEFATGWATGQTPYSHLKPRHIRYGLGVLYKVA
jgi:hypothetical protein